MPKNDGKASREARSKKARLRQIGMFNDLASFVMEWRLNGGTSKYPPDARMRDYLCERGWKAERGGPVTIRTVQEMLRFMDSDLNALPTAWEERLARIDGEFLPGTETMYVGYTPEFWLEYRDAVMNGWTPVRRRVDADGQESSGDEAS